MPLEAVGVVSTLLSTGMLTRTRLAMDICPKGNALKGNDVATSDCSLEGLLDVSKHERMRRASGMRLLDS